MVKLRHMGQVMKMALEPHCLTTASSKHAAFGNKLLHNICNSKSQSWL